MRHHVEGMVEGCDRRNDAHRFALGEDFAILAVMRDVTGENLPIIQDRKLAGQIEDVEGAATFVDRILLG